MNLSRYANIPTGKSWPGRKVLRRMGYLTDQQGIINRYLRERDGWKEHLQNTREFVLQCLEEAQPSCINVLGSGWLLDFPLEEAHSICSNIKLTDIWHPPQVVRKVSGFKGVQLNLEDITGGMIYQTYKFMHAARKIRGSSSLKNMERLIPEKEPGAYYVSLNILNQLDIILVDYLQKYLRPDETELNDFRSFLQQSHIGLLQSHGCLVTDIEEIREDFNGSPSGTKNLLYTPLPPSKMRKDWTWNFDTSGFYHPATITRMKVLALSC